MIFVSGTKRSGTSMWMQVLQAAGLPILGKAFSRNGGTSPLRDANPDSAALGALAIEAVAAEVAEAVVDAAFGLAEGMVSETVPELLA